MSINIHFICDICVKRLTYTKMRVYLYLCLCFVFITFCSSNSRCICEWNSYRGLRCEKFRLSHVTYYGGEDHLKPNLLSMYEVDINCDIQEVNKNNLKNMKNIYIYNLKKNGDVNLDVEKFSNNLYIIKKSSEEHQLENLLPEIQNSKNLQILNLSDNKLRELPVFVSMELVDLNLRKNKIKDLPEDSFKNNNKIICLKLGHNNLKYLPAKLVYNLINLQLIDFSQNELTTIPNNFFSNNKQLSVVMLHDNKLTTINEHIFNKETNLKFLSLFLNLFNCDCVLTVFQKYYKKIPNLYESGKKVSDPICLSSINQIDKNCKEPEVIVPKYFQNIVADSDIILQCSYNIGNVSWLRDNMLIRNDTGKYLLTEEQEPQISISWLYLTIYNVQENDSGEYR